MPALDRANDGLRKGIHGGVFCEETVNDGSHEDDTRAFELFFVKGQRNLKSTRGVEPIGVLDCAGDGAGFDKLQAGNLRFGHVVGEVGEQGQHLTHGGGGVFAIMAIDGEMAEREVRDQTPVDITRDGAMGGPAFQIGKAVTRRTWACNAV